MVCPLCKNINPKRQQEIAGVLFLTCSQCGSLFKHSTHWPTLEVEKNRYETHNNDVTDQGYQNFVMPIVKAVKKDFKTTANGLDFGAGTGPVINNLLSSDGYSLNLFDPFFYPDTAVLNKTYDFIICCEVIEHFHHPSLEFQRLYDLLNEDGKLYCMTELVPETPLKNWHYQRDLTHVIFYSEENLIWIQEHFGFKKLTIDGRLIIFEK